MKTYLLSFLLFVMPALAELNTPEILEGYHLMNTALSHDAFKETESLAGKYLTVLDTWLKEAGSENPQRESVLALHKGATALASTSQEEELRVAFSVLSEGMVSFIRKDPGLQKKYQLFFCPMVSHYAYWVQPKGEKIANPYMGLKMLVCGSKKPW